MTCRIGGTVTIDLRHCDPFTCARRMQVAAEAPAGADVVLVVARGQRPPTSAVHYVREYGKGLGSLVVSCPDPGTVRAWVETLRGLGEAA